MPGSFCSLIIPTAASKIFLCQLRITTLVFGQEAIFPRENYSSLHVKISHVGSFWCPLCHMLAVLPTTSRQAGSCVLPTLMHSQLTWDVRYRPWPRPSFSQWDCQVMLPAWQLVWHLSIVNMQSCSSTGTRVGVGGASCPAKVVWGQLAEKLRVAAEYSFDKQCCSDNCGHPCWYGVSVVRLIDCVRAGLCSVLKACRLSEFVQLSLLPVGYRHLLCTSASLAFYVACELQMY